jgi:hypothetical protein
MIDTTQTATRSLAFDPTSLGDHHEDVIHASVDTSPYTHGVDARYEAYLADAQPTFSGT